MNLRNFLLACIVLAGCVWWYSSHSADDTAAALLASPGCPLPPRAEPGGSPLQSDLPTSMPLFSLPAATLKPLAGFSVDARVLSREDYYSGREADLSPTDLALGWRRMRDDAVLSQLRISQSSRWYHYQWDHQPPLPPEEIVRSSANMHMIPASPIVAAALERVRKDEHLRIDGWLVEANAADGWHWRSSTSRDDTGAGACEVVYVCAITPL